MEFHWQRLGMPQRAIDLKGLEVALPQIEELASRFHPQPMTAGTHLRGRELRKAPLAFKCSVLEVYLVGAGLVIAETEGEKSQPQ